MIIALNGPPRAGKTTARNLLCWSHGCLFLDLSRPFKTFLNQSLGINQDDADFYKDKSVQFIDGVPHEIGSSSIRRAQIEIAAAVERVDPAVWVRRVVTDSYRPNGRIYVLDSIGKEMQWRWLTRHFGDEVILWTITRGSGQGFRHSGMYTDDRHHIVPSRFSVQPQLHFHIDNTPLPDRTASSLNWFNRSISAEFHRLEEWIERRGQ